MPISFKYGAEALFFLGLAYGLIKWVGRTLRSLTSDSRMEAAAIEAMAANVPSAGADALVRQGLVSAEDLAAMSPRERGFLLATAGPQVDAVAGRGGRSRQATPRSLGALPNAPAGVPGRSAASPRLHLITPSRPPLGVAVHCPSCGSPLDREGLQRVGSTACGRCKRRVSAHIQRGRLTVIVDETPEEAEHRRRLDGE